MKVDKYIWDDGKYYYYYTNSKINKWLFHGLYHEYRFGIGYYYHDGMKGFWLRNKKMI